MGGRRNLQEEKNQVGVRDTVQVRQCGTGLRHVNHPCMCSSGGAGKAAHGALPCAGHLRAPCGVSNAPCPPVSLGGAQPKAQANSNWLVVLGAATRAILLVAKPDEP